MATNYDELQSNFEQDPEAWVTHVADGIRKKFGDEFDFSGLSDRDVIQRHHARFGADMSPDAYQARLNVVYGKDFKPPAPKPEPPKPLMERAKEVAKAAPEVIKETAKGLAPFVVGAAAKTPLVGQTSFLLGHAANAVTDAATMNALEATRENVPETDVFAKTRQYYQMLLPGLTAKGYTPEQVFQEAAHRVENLQRGYRETTQSLDEDVAKTQRDIVLEPAKAATDAFFLGVGGAPAVEGVLQKGLARVGLAKTAGTAAAKSGWMGNVANHMVTGAVIGAPGMAIQEGADHAVLAAAEGRPTPEIAAELVKGAKSGLVHGLAGGAILGGAAGALQEGAGAAIRPITGKRAPALAPEARAALAQDEVDAARLRGWQEVGQRTRAIEAVARTNAQAAEAATREGARQATADRVAAIQKTADDFNPYTSKVPVNGDPAEAATSIIQAEHGDDAAMSEPGLRAASKIEERIKLFQDANAEVNAFGERGLPSPELSPGESAPAPAGGPPLGPIERGGVEPAPAEIAPLQEPATPAQPPAAEVPRTEAATPGRAPLWMQSDISGNLVPQRIEANVGAPSAEPTPAPIPAPAQAIAQSKPERAVASMNVGNNASVKPAGNGVMLERLGPEPGATEVSARPADTLDEIVRKADEHEVPVVTRITQVAGPRGGKIPVEKQIEWYRQRGFEVMETTKLPEGQIATATLMRQPKPLPARKIGMLEAQKKLYERAIQNPVTPAEKELAAPDREPGPGRYHEANLWADANIAAARERIAQREAEFPEQERLKRRERGSIGDVEGRDPSSYDWADFADRVQIGVNVIIKHGLNKAEWVEHMVRELGGKFRAIADRVYQESVAAFQARRPNGNDEVRRVVDDYVHGAGLGRGATAHDVYPEVDPKFATRVAHAYDALKNASEGSPEWKAAAASYEALNQEIEAQFKAMQDAGYKVTFTSEDPYPTSADMRADVAQNKHIKAFKTPDESFHPFMTPEQNDKFRAVHDFFGHASEGYEFGPRGEDAAFRKHASTLSNKAVPALATETRGQNSWVNFMPENAALQAKDRPFAEQKFGLLPKWAYDDVLRARENRAPASGLSAGIVQRGPAIRGDERALETAASKLSKGVRPVRTPGGVRSRFVSDGNSAVNEMMRVSPESATWYHDDIERMHGLTEKEVPEIKEPGNRTLFDLLLGFTSPNTNVPQNYARALVLMKDYLRSGRVPMLQRFGQEVNIGSRHWVPRLNGLIDRFGGDLDKMRDWLLTKDEKGTYNVEREFGDKVGPFTLNIQGIHDQVTVDVWMVRRLRRLAGTLYKDVDGKRVLNEDWAPTNAERRDIEASIHELSKQTGLDPDAVQATLWDSEKMIWERAGLSAPRIPFSVAAERVLQNMTKRGEEIAAKIKEPEQRSFFSPLANESGAIRVGHTPTQLKQQQDVMLKVLRKRGRLVDPSNAGRQYGESSVWLAPDGKTYVVPEHEAASEPAVRAAKLSESTSGYQGMYRWTNHAMLQRGFIRVQPFPEQVNFQVVAQPTAAQRASLGKLAKGRDVWSVISSWDGLNESPLIESLSGLLRELDAGTKPNIPQERKPK